MQISKAEMHLAFAWLYKQPPYALPALGPMIFAGL